MTGTIEAVLLPKSNVMQLFTEDGSKISVRPSGTEPKIKFYIGLKTELPSKDMLKEKTAYLDEKIELIKKDLGIA